MSTFIVIVIFLAIIVPLALAGDKSRSAEIVRRWAERNGFTIKESEFRALKRGPFSLTTWNYQAVRRIVVTGQDGKQKTGWIRCSPHWPWPRDRVEVRWDEEEPQPQP